MTDPLLPSAGVSGNHEPDSPTRAEESPIPGQRPVSVRSSFATALSWLLILAAVAAAQLSRNQDTSAAQHKFVPDPGMQIMGRYIVGMKSFLGKAVPVDASLQELQRTQAQSRNPRQRLLLIPILMESASRNDALKDLRRLAAGSSRDPATRDAAIFLQLYQEGSRSLSEEQIRTISVYGWSGRLALSHDQPPSDPMRRAVILTAVRTFLATAAGVVIAMAALGAGTVLLIIAFVLWKRKKLRMCFAPPPAPGAFLLEAFAIAMTGMMVLPLLLNQTRLPYQTTALSLLLTTIILAVAWPRLRGWSWSDTRAAFGWHRGNGIWREMGAGIAGYLVGLPLLMIALIPAWFLMRFTKSTPSHPAMDQINGDPGALIALLLLACLWAPVVEETLFRGMLFGHLCRRWHWAVSGVLTGLLFALVHPQGWVAVPTLGMIGFILCAIRQWRGSLIASMTAHALNNGAVLVFLFILLS